MILYDYFRSTACYRVRIALNLKNIAYEKKNIHLIDQGGEQHSEQYKNINPQGLVPALAVDGHILNQSLAIIAYLDETFPSPALLPHDPFEKATVRSLASLVSCDMHPLNNLRVLNRLKHQFSADQTQITTWYHHWLKTGFDAFETQLQSIQRNQAVCLGDSISLADLCLIPQVYNARRFNFSLDPYPLIRAIDAYCLTIPAIIQASPDFDGALTK